MNFRGRSRYAIDEPECPTTLWATQSDVRGGFVSPKEAGEKTEKEGKKEPSGGRAM